MSNENNHISNGLDTPNVEFKVPLPTDPNLNNIGSTQDYYQVDNDRGGLVGLEHHHPSDNVQDTELPDVEGATGHLDHCHVPPTPGSKLARNQLIAVSVLCIVFMIGEIIGGVIANSLALITDATHLASDLTGFMISLFAIWVATKPATTRMSFGFYRAEVLGAMLSVLIIWIASGILFYMAVKRAINQDYEIKANEMLITAAAGVLFNILMAITLNSSLCSKIETKFGHNHSHGGHGHSHGGHGHAHGDQGQSQGHSSEPGQLVVEDDSAKGKAEVAQRNINVRAALIHVIGDLIQSIGVLIAAIIIKVKPEYKLADPICTFVFSVLVLFTTITILRDAFFVIMEAVPRDIDYASVKEALQAIEGVKATHSLHVWALTLDKNAVAVHLAIEPDTEYTIILKEATRLLREKYNINHSTIQVEHYQEEIMSLCNECIGPAYKIPQQIVNVEIN